MLNINDFTLMPLAELVHHEELKKQFLDMMDILYERYEQGGDGRTMACVFDNHSPGQMRFNFAAYVESSKTWSRSGPLYNSHSYALVDQKQLSVLGFTINTIRCKYDDTHYIDGADIIHPDYRRQGYAKIMLALRMSEAKNLNTKFIGACVANNNLGTVKRVNKLENAGLAEFDVRSRCGTAKYYKLWAVDDAEIVHDAMMRPDLSNIEMCCDHKCEPSID